jgi:hypothetical protein
VRSKVESVDATSNLRIQIAHARALELGERDAIAWQRCERTDKGEDVRVNGRSGTQPADVLGSRGSQTKACKGCRGQKADLIIVWSNLKGPERERKKGPWRGGAAKTNDLGARNNIAGLLRGRCCG